MCPLFFEAASSTPICCITNTTKPIFIIERDYSSLSTQEETKQLLLKSLCTIIMELFLEERIPCPRKTDFMQIMWDPILQPPSTQHVYSGADSTKIEYIFCHSELSSFMRPTEKKNHNYFCPFFSVFLLEMNNYGFCCFFFPLPLATWESFAIIVLFSFTLLIFSLSLFCFLWVKRVFHVCTRIFICPFRHLQYRILCQHIIYI